MALCIKAAINMEFHLYKVNCSKVVLLQFLMIRAPIQRGDGLPAPWKIATNIGFLSNAGPDPMKNNTATNPAFDFGPSSARQRNAI